MTKRMKRINAAMGVALAVTMTLAVGVAGLSSPAPVAQAATRSELQLQRASKQSRLKSLNAQLKGVSADLAQQIKDLDDLTNNQIPAAQAAAEEAAQQAATAQDAADAAATRLEAARKDQEDLEARIAATGEDYDDAREAVAQMARASFHTSDATQLMSVMTNSSSTKDFVDKMQADAAIARNKANAANAAAEELNTSMNRKQRLDAIKDQVAALKEKADQESAAAQKASADAKAKQAELAELQEQGNQRRAALESQQSKLKTSSAKEAADIVRIQSELASMAQPNVGGGVNTNGDYTGPKPGGNNGGHSGGNSSSNNGGHSGGNTSGNGGNGGGNAGNNGGGNAGGNTGGASGMNYAVPGSCPSGSGFCYGHSVGPGGNVGSGPYPSRQCTLWAYLRRSQLSLPVGSYMGNGGQWDDTARAYGYLVNRTPHAGALIVIQPGQVYGGSLGRRAAHRAYGHVAVVERVNSDGSILISQGGTGFATFPASEILYDPGNYVYIHY